MEGTGLAFRAESAADAPPREGLTRNKAERDEFAAMGVGKLAAR